MGEAVAKETEAEQAATATATATANREPRAALLRSQIPYKPGNDSRDPTRATQCGLGYPQLQPQLQPQLGPSKAKPRLNEISVGVNIWVQHLG